MKYLSLMMAVFCTLSLGFASCNDDDDDPTTAPSIELEEANIEGDELCVEADIAAPGRTASIVINITDANGQTVKASQTVSGSQYIGVLNIEDFHMHVDIRGKQVAAGDLLKLTVGDALGQQTTAVKSITEDK